MEWRAEQQALGVRVDLFGHSHHLVLVAPVHAEQTPETAPVGGAQGAVAILAGKCGGHFNGCETGQQQRVSGCRCTDRSDAGSAWLRSVVAPDECRGIKKDGRH